MIGGISNPPKPLYCVSLSNNKDPKARDQYCDIGETFDVCMKRAKGYTQSSYYQTIAIIELGVVEVWEIIP